MTVRSVFSTILRWTAVPLGIASLGFSIYFGIDVIEIWTRPVKPPTPPVGPGAGLFVVTDLPCRDQFI